MLEIFKSTKEPQKKSNMVERLSEIFQLHWYPIPLEMPLFFYRCIFILISNTWEKRSWDNSLYKHTLI